MSEIKRCLIVDDDQDDQEIFMMCIHNVSKDIECKAMNNGVDAIAMLQRDDADIPDYIFLDVNMPKLNGINCLRELRKLEKLNSTKIFMYSTTSESRVVEESKEYGANDFIMKPTKTAELTEKLSAIL